MQYQLKTFVQFIFAGDILGREEGPLKAFEVGHREPQKIEFPEWAFACQFYDIKLYPRF